MYTNTKKSKLIISIVIGLFHSYVSAQENINTSGGNTSGSVGSVAYSIGQTVYNTHTSTNASVSQGVQQPYEISIVTEVKEAKDILLSFVVYPNPTTNLLKLKTNSYNNDNLTYYLYQLDSKILETKKIENAETSISMEHLASGVYFLKISELNKDIKTFQIIKN